MLPVLEIAIVYLTPPNSGSRNRRSKEDCLFERGHDILMGLCSNHGGISLLRHLRPRGASIIDIAIFLMTSSGSLDSHQNHQKVIKIIRESLESFDSHQSH